MNKTNIIKRLNRLIELGPIGTIKRIKNKAQKKLFLFKFKKKILQKNKNKCDLSWQKDFNTVKAAKTWGNKLLFFSDIKIESVKNNNIFDYHPDIKIPWEKSRFQNLYSLGQDYHKTNDEKNAQEFQKQVNNWIDNNPFLLGVNWACPMEVAIRAINWIYAFQFFKNSKTISPDFLQKFTNSLHEHMIYLEGNFEESDKPNNHYLSDLIGYFYLTIFFKNLKKQKWVIKKLLKQFDQQIQDDGTSYEGSTNYHKFVTEIFWHLKILCQNNHIKLPEHFYEKFNKMIRFINDCTDQSGNFVQIGDNDSGRILDDRSLSFDYAPVFVPPDGGTSTGRQDERRKDSLPNFIQNKYKTKKQFFTDIKKNCPPLVLSVVEGFERSNYSHYPNFGLTIIKKNNCHITFRHPTFNKKQPTGHFHQDELSITLSVDRIPILVDPGTYVYTANSFARNYFRSYQSHNTFFEKKQSKFEDLFQLPRKKQNDIATIEHRENNIILSNHTNNLYRKLIHNPDKETLEIYDSFNKNLDIEWNFIFHPKIILEKQKNYWLIKKDKKEILKIYSDIKFEKSNGFFSESYGKIEPCLKLTGQKNGSFDNIKIIFTKL
ncbi:MAG: heparinase II/III family protein [bacterium]